MKYPARETHSCASNAPTCSVSVFAGHAAHACLSKPSLNVPRGHGTHAKLFGSCTPCPCMQTQSARATEDAAPRVVWNCPHWQHPARRLAQPSVELPCCSLYVPVWHAVHTPFASTYPARHTQYGDAESKTPVEEASSLSHSLQPLARPATALYFPAGHAEHAAITESAPSVVSYPAAHRHAVLAVLASDEDACSGQSEHAPLPAAILYLPSEQAWHAPPSGP